MKFENLLLPKSKWQQRLFYGLLIFITIVLVLGTINLEIDTDITILLPENKETKSIRNKIEEYNKEFPISGAPLFIAIEDAFINKDNIDTIKKMTDEITALECVSSIVTPFNTVYFKSVTFPSGKKTFVPKKAISQNYDSDETLKEHINDISKFKYINGSIISTDKKSAGILVYMDDTVKASPPAPIEPFKSLMEFFFDRNYEPQFIDRTYFFTNVEKIVKKYEKALSIHLAGIPVYESKSKEYMTRDIVVLLIPAIVMMILTLFLNFKSTRGTFLPIISMLLSMGWTIGLMGWLRMKLNVVGILIPPIIMTIGSSYTLHYLNSYYMNSKNKKVPRNLVIISTKKIFPTIAIAAFTTIIGFASFLTAKIEAIKVFGIFIIISIGLTLFFTFFVLSKILAHVDIPDSVKVDKVKDDLFSKFLFLTNKLIIPLRYLWVLFFIGSIVLFGLFITHLKVDTNAENFFKKNDKVKKSLSFVQYNFNGANTFNILLRSEIPNYFRTVEGLKEAQKINDFLNSGFKIKGHTVIGWNMSPVSLIEDLNMALEGEYDIPQDEKIITRFFNMLKVSGESITSLFNDDYSAINFQVRSYSSDPKKDHNISEKDLLALNDLLTTELNKIASEKGNIKVELWGESMLLAKISKYLVRDQIISLLFTVAFVLIITFILFRSLYFSLSSIIPLTFGVLMNFTIMSIFGISLDAATVMIAAISIGIGIDDSIHFILHYRSAIKKGKNVNEAVTETLNDTSRPILFTSLALIAGFSVFLFSSFSPVTFFGLLIAISMFNCTFATLFILPSYFLITDKFRKNTNTNKL